MWRQRSRHLLLRCVLLLVMQRLILSTANKFTALLSIWHNTQLICHRLQNRITFERCALSPQVSLITWIDFLSRRHLRFWNSFIFFLSIFFLLCTFYWAAITGSQFSRKLYLILHVLIGRLIASIIMLRILWNHFLVAPYQLPSQRLFSLQLFLFWIDIHTVYTR